MVKKEGTRFYEEHRVFATCSPQNPVPRFLSSAGGDGKRQAPARGRFCGRQTSCHPFCQTAGEENYTNELSVDDLAVLVFKRLQVL